VRGQAVVLLTEEKGVADMANASDRRTVAQPSAAPRYPMRRQDPFDPPPELARVRESRPVCPVTLWDGGQAWLLTRYRDVRALLGDPRMSADPRCPGYPFLSEARSTARDGAGSFNHLDAPLHEVYRRTVGPEFTVERIAALRPMIEAVAAERVARLAALTPPVDLAAELALPVPSTVICHLLGIPYADHGVFETRTGVRMRLDATPADVRQANQAILDHLTDVVRRKLRTPGDDLISRLCVRYVRTGELSVADAVDIVRLLLVNGYETTANMITLGVLVLLTQDRTAAEFGVGVGAAPGSGLPAVVEELLRYQTIVHIAPTRAVRADVELHGTLLRAGDGVITSLAAANRDPEVFADPDVFDPGRRTRRHLAFGSGVHHCLGHPLARLELAVVLDTLFRRLPALRLAVPVADLRFKHDMGLYGVHRLPVTW
jgi:cytochrome P450